jgi:hypothetical protein
MRIYIAAKFSANERLRHERDRIHRLGLGTVISTWLDKTDVTNDSTIPVEVAEDEALKEAQRDLFEVVCADLIIVDTEGPTRRGGRESEYGAGLALRFWKNSPRVWSVGPRWTHGKNIFLTLVDRHFLSWDDVLDALTKEAA